MLFTRPRLITVFGIPSLYCLYILLATSLYLPYVIGIGVFEVKLGEMQNPGGRDAKRHCCFGSESSSGICTSPCHTVIITCLRQFRPAHPADCTYGHNISRVLGSNSFVFTTGNLVRFPISSNWPGSFSLKIAAVPAGKLKKTITEVLVKSSSFGANHQWNNHTHTVHLDNGLQISLSFSYRFICSKDNYGSDCSKTCVARDDQYGHFSCDADGNRVCMNGWGGGPSDLFCENPICNLSCRPNGFCVGPNTCRCSPGWQGPTCNQCEVYPGCVHGTCQNKWDCNCNRGWGGPYCDLELDYCGRNNPCTHGNCKNTAPGRYKCLCHAGYGGLNCDSEINECASNPCKNGGNCTDKFAGYTCACPAGFRGNQCELNIDDCKDNACANGATCIDGVLSYLCHCPAGFTGKLCEVMLPKPTERPAITGTTGTIGTIGTISYNTTQVITTTSISQGNNTVVGGHRIEGSSQWQHQVINIVIPVVICVVVLICLIVGCVLWKFYRKQCCCCCCCGTTTTSSRDPEEPNTRTTIKRVDGKELNDDVDDLKRSRVGTSNVKTNTPDIIINFVPSRQHHKNVNSEQASRTRKGKETDLTPLEESRFDKPSNHLQETVT